MKTITWLFLRGRALFRSCLTLKSQLAALVYLVSFGSLLAQAPKNWNPADTDPTYEARKMQSQTASPNQQVSTNAFVGTFVALPSCFEPYDTTANGGWTRLPRQDDNSIGPIALGWSFSLFGSVYSSVYINTNGNVTFAAPLSQYTATGFPIGTPMVAPFWADVDTRNANSGSVWYKIFPDRLVVTWSFVGYYNTQADKKNTFQLVLRNNTAPGFSGDDVLFSYGDMQWTTGSASGGVNGFGGSAATVGINRGNSVDYIQTGRFNLAGGQAPTLSTPGGIDWLDGKCFTYRLGGTATNLPPVVAGMPTGNQIVLNQGETRVVPLQFTGPESNQNVNVTANLNGLCNAVAPITNNATPSATASFSVTASPCNVGTKQVVFTATDNGTPAATQSFTLTVVVNPPPPTNLPPVFNGPLPALSGQVGISFGYTLPAGTFTDPNNDALTYSATGLPPGLSFTGTTISGVPTTVGTYTATITATDPGPLSTTGTIVITITDVPPTNLPPVFNGPIPSLSGQVGVSFGYTLPVGVFTDPNNDALVYSAIGLPPGLIFSGTTISGVPTTVGTYTAMITATDPGSLSATGTIIITITDAPTTGQFDIATVETVSCLTVTAYERRLTFLPKYTGLTGQPVTFSVVNELSPTTQPGPYSLRVYIDNPTITLKASQAGTAGEATYAYNWLATCAGTTPPPPTPVPVSFTITSVSTVACTSVTAFERRLSFTPQYAGLTGQPVTFSVVNELSPTTQPGPYSLRVYIDNPTITLKASQAGTAGEATYTYNWLAVCGSTNGRQAASTEYVAPLNAHIYPNPVGDELTVGIANAEGQTVRFQLINPAGAPFVERAVPIKTADHREHIPMSQYPAGLYLLRLTTGQQTTTLKVVHQ
ncbi:nidogen-like domain-containing protein [Spirosoma rhododendri]|uniref:T9SS type A sorting domain-containing protein n=1 Tax=Spirosoma rhododendri TaxID=2728024 RepID=A0A7L5DIM5_9BACT|nr:nidogen-like domain-containing protein [Spirosoma rhododendri]QJD77905.1 T9SS type A sorting domain-containing protein [Spirosoma rhododendri]